MKFHRIIIALGLSSILAVIMLTGVSPALAIDECLTHPVTGTVKWFDDPRGYGFIRPDSGSDIFVHYSAIVDSGPHYLDEGDRVEFTIGEGPEGPQAVDVRRISQ